MDLIGPANEAKENHPMSKLNILVSGASIAGLTAAHWLSRYGFNVTIVERAPHLRPGGQALDLRGAAALSVAEQMGLLTKLRELSTKFTGMSVVNAKGQEIFRSTGQTLTGGRFDSADVEIMRDHLVQVLYEAAGDRVEYLFNDSITRLDQDETGVDVAFVNAPPRRFDLVIGADGVRSNVRRIAFGPDERFLHYLGAYISLFSAPNFLGLDHWQVFCQDETALGALLVQQRDAPARVYLGFHAAEPADYDYRDSADQKRLMAERVGDKGWEFPRLLAHMQDAPDFYFDSINQVRMDSWSQGRVVLLGDAGYAVSVTTGQGTAVAMIAAYVLAGELATHRGQPLLAFQSYERELRDYVQRTQELAGDINLPELAPSEDAADGPDQVIDPDSVPDYGDHTIPFDLRDYRGALGD